MNTFRVRVSVSGTKTYEIYDDTDEDYVVGVKQIDGGVVQA